METRKMARCRTGKTPTAQGKYSMNFPLFIKALGLAFILEGIPYFLFAERMPSVLEKLLEKPTASLRKLGLSALLFGLVLIYLSQGI